MNLNTGGGTGIAITITGGTYCTVLVGSHSHAIPPQSEWDSSIVLDLVAVCGCRCSRHSNTDTVLVPAAG